MKEAVSILSPLYLSYISTLENMSKVRHSKKSILLLFLFFIVGGKNGILNHT